MQNAWLKSDKYQFLSHRFDLTSFRTHGSESQDLLIWEMDAQLIRPSHLVNLNKHLILTLAGVRSKCETECICATLRDAGRVIVLLTFDSLGNFLRVKVAVVQLLMKALCATDARFNQQ